MLKKLLITSLLLAAGFINGCGNPPQSSPSPETGDHTTAVGVCGDGKVTGNEKCDRGISSSTAQGYCPTKSQCNSLNDDNTIATYSGNIIDCTAECTQTERKCDNTKKDSFCPSSCDETNDLDCKKSTTIPQKPNKKECNTSGQADATKCDQQRAETCLPEAGSFYCNPPRECTSNADPAKGDETLCGDPLLECRKDGSVFHCLPRVSCDNGGQPDDSKCNKANFDFCAKVNGTYTCVSPVSCALASDKSKPDNSQCTIPGTSCQASTKEFLCLPAPKGCKSDTSDKPDDSKCPKNNRCYTDGTKYECHVPPICGNNAPDDSICAGLPGATCKAINAGGVSIYICQN